MGFTSGQTGSVSRAGDVMSGQLGRHTATHGKVEFGIDSDAYPAVVFDQEARIIFGDENEFQIKNDSSHRVLYVAGSERNGTFFLEVGQSIGTTPEVAIIFNSSCIAADAPTVDGGTLYVDSLTRLLSFKDSSGVVHTLL